MTFEEARQRADKGDAFAQTVVALQCQLGWNTKKDPQQAVKYASASANAGEPLGQFRLGALLRAGEGIAKDEQQGLAYQAASFSGLSDVQDPYSMTAVGILIFQGKVVGQNVPKDQRRKDAANLYKKAADMGYAPAQFNYAMCTEAGHGIPKNESLRQEYLRKAAADGYRLAADALSRDKLLSQPAPSDGGHMEILSGAQENSVPQDEPRQNVSERNEPSLVFQYRNPSATVVAENDRHKVVSSVENVLYLLHKRTGLVLGQEELGPGAIKSAVLSPSSRYLAVHFHNGGGAGASFPVYNLSSGTLEKVAEHWPDSPVEWANPLNEPSFMRHFGNSVERIGVKNDECLVFQCEEQMFAVGILSDKADPQALRSTESVKFSEEPTETASGVRLTLQDGFWSAAQFVSGTHLVLAAALPGDDEVFRPLFAWTSRPAITVRLNILSLQMQGNHSLQMNAPVRMLPDSSLVLGDRIELQLHTFHGSRGVGRSIDFGTWAVVRDRESGKSLLFAQDSEDHENDPDWPSQRDDYKDRVNSLLRDNGICEAPVMASGFELAAFNYEHGALFCKDAVSLMILEQDFGRKRRIRWNDHFEFVAVNADFSLAAGVKRVGLVSPNYIQIFNINDEKAMGNLVVGSRGAVLIDPDGNYMARGLLPEVIGFRNGLEAYPFEQFDLQLNRPDIVLERLGAPEEAVAITKQLREKRLKRMGVTEEMLKPDVHVPELEILGDVPATTDAGEINLSIKASDSKYLLERLKVYVNNVPVNGRDGELLREESKTNAGLLGRISGVFAGASTGPQTLERTIPIKLAAGRNKIQVSVLNNAGAESLYANAEVNCTAKRPKPTLYAVAMGVSEYSNPDWNLTYAAKDARDVLARLKTRAGDNYGEVKELLLTDKEVTKESIANIKEFLGGATIDDTVLMFVAGHGLLDSKYDYYFGTTDIDFDNPADKGIAFEEFDDLLADLPSLKKSLLIDTCHAGELDEEEKTLLASAGGVSAALPTANGVAVRSIGTRGMNVKAIEGARGASEWYDRLQGLFVDLRRGSGSTILSSSAGAEYALESSEQQNGLFTYAVLEALDGKREADTNKDGSVQMSELGEYVKKRVSELTNNKQTPNTRRVNLEGDFALAKTK